MEFILRLYFTDSVLFSRQPERF